MLPSFYRSHCYTIICCAPLGLLPESPLVHKASTQHKGCVRDKKIACWLLHGWHAIQSEPITFIFRLQDTWLPTSRHVINTFGVWHVGRSDAVVLLVLHFIMDKSRQKSLFSFFSKRGKPESYSEDSICVRFESSVDSSSQWRASCDSEWADPTREKDKATLFSGAVEKRLHMAWDRWINDHVLFCVHQNTTDKWIYPWLKRLPAFSSDRTL